MKRAFLLLVVCLFASPLFAQDAAPQPLFSQTTSAVAIRIGGQTVVGADVIGAFNLTKNIILESDNVLAPSNNFQGYYGGVRYNVNSLLKNVLAKTNVSPTMFNPYIHAALGVDRNVPATGPVSQHISAMIGGGFDYDPNGAGKFMLGPRIEYLNAPGFGKSPSGVIVSASLTFILGSK